MLDWIKEQGGMGQKRVSRVVHPADDAVAETVEEPISTIIHPQEDEPLLALEGMGLEPTSRTIYSCDDAAERAMLKVPLQVVFTGPSHVLSSDLADTRLTDLGIRGILSRMNTILRTDRNLSPPLETLLHYCLAAYADFGQAYALLRPRWQMEPSEALEDIQTCQNADQALRAAAIDHDIIVHPFSPPRRLWDLWSNRVVPIWMTTPFQGERDKTWFAVSHSWMPDNLRRTVDSAINGYEWPVPIPIDTTLERVRVELLNHASKHDVNLVWLDVLCLRQVGTKANENLRADEWKLDVPTIGNLYPDAHRTVYYFSGLGRPFEAVGFDSPRHWQNRAWTLQETNPNRIVGGCSPHSPSMPGIDTRDMPVDEAIRPFYEKIDAWESFSHVVDSVFAVLDAMRHRSATSELDKIAGLNYYLAKFSPLPAYIVQEIPEDAWSRLIKATNSMQRADLFFLFPEPGNGKHVWCPSWQQVKDVSTLPQRNTLREYINLDESNTYSISGYCLEHCFVEGLSEVGSQSVLRTGKILVVDTKGEEHNIPVVANHTTPIADGYYTLIGGKWADRWVVAHKKESDLFEKLSVIHVQGDDLNRKMRYGRQGDAVIRLL